MEGLENIKTSVSEISDDEIVERLTDREVIKRLIRVLYDQA